MRKRVSGRDVAREAGVSQATVSLVLNGREDVRISAATRARVVEAARQMGYIRSAPARALVTGRTERIGFVPGSPDLLRHHDAYSMEVLAGVMEAAPDLDHDVLLHSSRQPHWQALYRDVLSGSTDGVLLVGRPPRDLLTHSLRAAGFPTVCISFHPEEEPHFAVDCDNEAAGALAVEHLLALGHRRIGLVALDASASWARERYAGASRAMAGVPDAQLAVLDIGPGVVSGPGSVAPAMEAILSLDPRPTGLIFTDEWQAQAVAAALAEAGCPVPESTSVVSFNSTRISAGADPPLTSVWQPLAEIGKAAASLLVDLVHGREVPPGVRRFPVRLDVRSSTAAAPAGR